MFSSQDKVNGVGSRVMSAGIDVEQYKNNSVLLYMHQRFGKEDMPIGRVEDLRLEGDKWLGRPVFDENDPYAKRIADKWENGFLKMCSPVLEILETSTDPLLMLAGQTRPTVTRSKLVEISIADIGSNDDHLQLSYQGNVLKLAHGEACEALPLLTEKQPAEGAKNADNKMNEDLKFIALALGMPEGSTREQIVAAIAPIKEQAARVETLSLAAITTSVEAHGARLKLTEEQKKHFLSLGKQIGVEALESTLVLMHPAAKPMDVLKPGSGDKQTLELKFDAMTPDQLMELRTNDREKYVALYKDKYGYAPTIEA